MNDSDCLAGAEAARECGVRTCYQRCALDVIDELLRSPLNRVSGEEVDLLLDLR